MMNPTSTYFISNHGNINLARNSHSEQIEDKKRHKSHRFYKLQKSWMF